MENSPPMDNFENRCHPFVLVQSMTFDESQSIRVLGLQPVSIAVQRRILIVDDEAFNLIGIKSIIKSMDQFKGIGQLIDTASNGFECIEKVKEGFLPQNNYTYSLILMDLSMPGMDGYEATEAVRELYENR